MQWLLMTHDNYYIVVLLYVTIDSKSPTTVEHLQSHELRLHHLYFIIDY